jgi:hypothetical protein
MLHRIPDDGAPHAPTTECGCDPHPKIVAGDDGLIRSVMQHTDMSGSDVVGGDGGGRTEHSGPGES